MRFNAKGFLVFIACGLLISLAATSGGGGWFYLTEAVVSGGILFGVAGFFSEHRTGRPVS
jgi:hypothetical protein